MMLEPSWTVCVYSHVLTAVGQLVVICLVVLLERFYPEDGGGTVLQNFETCNHYTLQKRKLVWTVHPFNCDISAARFGYKQPSRTVQYLCQ